MIIRNAIDGFRSDVIYDEEAGDVSLDRQTPIDHALPLKPVITIRRECHDHLFDKGRNSNKYYAGGLCEEALNSKAKTLKAPFRKENQCEESAM